MRSYLITNFPLNKYSHYDQRKVNFTQNFIPTTGLSVIYEQLIVTNSKIMKKKENNTKIKIYQTLDESTGEVKDQFKYMKGIPRQYRFNGQNGRFNLDGVFDKGNTIEIVPIAWRVFTADDLFKSDRLMFTPGAAAMLSLFFSGRRPTQPTQYIVF